MRIFIFLSLLLGFQALAQDEGLLRSYSEAVGAGDKQEQAADAAQPGQDPDAEDPEEPSSAEQGSSQEQEAQSANSSTTDEDSAEAGAMQEDEESSQAQTAVILPEYFLKISGIKDYRQFARIRRALLAALPSGSVIFEKVLSRQEKTYALRTQMPDPQLRQLLGRFPVKPGFLLLEDFDDNQIRARLE